MDGPFIWSANVKYKVCVGCVCFALYHHTIVISGIARAR